MKNLVKNPRHKLLFYVVRFHRSAWVSGTLSPYPYAEIFCVNILVLA